jgi:dihydrofolate reductase
MKLILIAALSRNRVIGKNGNVPWHLPEDMKRFKQLTTGHTVLMGRRSYESIGKPLPDRRNVVLSSHPVPGVETYTSINDALKALSTEPVIFIIGGGDVFRQTLALADALYLTLLDREVEGDTFFPEYEHLIGSRFRLAHQETREGFSFVDYERIA